MARSLPLPAFPEALVNELILKAIKPVLDGLFEKASAAIPGTVAGTVDKLVAILSTSHDAVNATLAGWYAQLVSKVTGWLPGVTPKLTRLATAALAGARAKFAKF